MPNKNKNENLTVIDGMRSRFFWSGRVANQRHFGAARRQLEICNIDSSDVDRLQGGGLNGFGDVE